MVSVLTSARTRCIAGFFVESQVQKNSYPSLPTSTCESCALWQQLAMNGVKQPDARKITALKIPSNLDSVSIYPRESGNQVLDRYDLNYVGKELKNVNFARKFSSR